MNARKTTIPKTPAARADALRQLKEQKTAANAHAFVRAAPKLFYEELEGKKHDALVEGPVVWISGDCHVENLGAVADARGTASIEMNDFDESVRNNPVFDVLRLSLSVSMACRAAGLSGLDVQSTVTAITEGYVGAHAQRGADQPFEVAVAPKRIQEMFDEAIARSQKHLLAKRAAGTKKARRYFPLGPKYWPLTKGEKAAIAKLLTEPAVRAVVTTMAGRHQDAIIDLVDCAFRIAGTSSLGRGEPPRS